MAQHQIVRYKAGKVQFEVLTVPGKCLEYRKGTVTLENAVLSTQIFKNAGKAEKASDADLAAAFEGVDALTEIMKKGELLLSAAERKEKVDKKRREIVTHIHKYYVDPKTKLPHPLVRIENALEAMKARIDGEIPVERQVAEIVKKLPEVLPIRKQGELEGTLSVPHKHMGAAGGLLKKYLDVRGENYSNSSCDMEVAILPANYDKFIAEMNRVTKGEFEFNVANASDTPAEPVAAKGKGKGKKGKRRG